MEGSKFVPTIEGAGGKEGGSVPTETANNLLAISTAKIVDVWCEGPIGGPIDANGVLIPAGRNRLKALAIDKVWAMDDDGVAQFKGLDFEVKLGAPDQVSLKRMQSVTSQVAVNTEIRKGTPVTRSVDDGIDALVITFMTPSFFKVLKHDGGDIVGTSVQLEVRIWADGASKPTEATRTVTIRGKTNTTYQRSILFQDIEDTFGTGPYNVEVLRLTKNSKSSAIQHQTFWDSYTNVVRERFSWPGVAYGYTEVQAKQFGSKIPTSSWRLRGLIECQIPNNYDPYLRTYTGIWDGGFTTGHTSNPVWALYTFAVNTTFGAGAYGMTAAHVNKFAFYQAAKYSDEFVSDGTLRNWTSKTYKAGAKVYHAYNAWESSVSTSGEPGVSGDWVATRDGLTIWAAGSYLEGAKVQHGRVIYRALENTSQEPGTGDEWEVYLTGLRPRYTCNYEFRTREEVYHFFNALGSTAWCRPWWGPGYLTLSQDAPFLGDPHLVTPSSVVDGKLLYSTTGLKARHSVVNVTWYDPANHYEAVVEPYEDPELIQQVGWNEQDVAPPGITSRAEAICYAKHTLETEREETNVLSFKGGWYYADCTPGSMLKVMDRKVSGLDFGGRVRTSAVSQIVIDRSVTLLAGRTYTLTCVLPDMSVEERIVTAPAGATNILTVSPNFTAAPLVNGQWILTHDQLAAQYFRVVGNKEESPGIFAVHAIQHDPSKYDRIYWSLNTEDDVPISTLPTGKLAAPKGVTVTQHTYEDGGKFATAVIVGWRQPEDDRAIWADVAYRRSPDGNWIRSGDSTDNSHTIKGLDPDLWDFRVRFRGMGVSEWTTVEGVSVVQPAGTLPPVTGFHCRGGGYTFNGRNCVLVWDDVAAGGTRISGEIAAGATTSVVPLGETVELEPNRTFFLKVDGLSEILLEDGSAALLEDGTEPLLDGEVVEGVAIEVVNPTGETDSLEVDDVYDEAPSTGVPYTLTYEPNVSSKIRLSHYLITIKSAAGVVKETYKVRAGTEEFEYTLLLNIEDFGTPTGNFKASIVAVDKWGNSSSSSTEITLASAAPPAITSVFVRGGGTSFESQDVPIAWTNPVYTGAIPAKMFDHYRVRIFDPSDDSVKRRVRVAYQDDEEESATLRGFYLYPQDLNVKDFEEYSSSIKVGVSAVNVYKVVGAETVVTLTQAAVPNVTGLQVKGGGTLWDGKLCELEWDDMKGSYLFSDVRFNYYRLRILTTGGTVMRTVWLKHEHFRYTYAMIRKDFTTPVRSFKVELTCRDVAKNASPTPAVITVSKAAPSLAGYTPTLTALYHGIEVDFADTTLDPENVKEYKILSGTTSPPTTRSKTIAATSKSTFLARKITASTTFYVQVVPVDEFGDGTGSAIASVTCNPRDIHAVLNTDGFSLSEDDGGKATFGGTNVICDANGITFVSPAEEDVRQVIKWKTGSVIDAKIASYKDTATNLILKSGLVSITDRDAYIRLWSSAYTGKAAEIYLDATRSDSKTSNLALKVLADGTSRFIVNADYITINGEITLPVDRFLTSDRDDTFTYDSTTMAHYGIGWFTDTWNALGGTAWLSGFCGVKLLTNGGLSFFVDKLGNTGIGPTLPGTDAARVLVFSSATAPTTYPADAVQAWAQDQAAGNKCLHLATEDGSLIRLFRGAALTAQRTTLTYTGEASDSADMTGEVAGGVGFATTLAFRNCMARIANLQIEMAELKERLGPSTGNGLIAAS